MSKINYQVKSRENFCVALSHDVDRTYKSFQFFTKSLQSLLTGNFKLCFYHIFSVFIKNPYWNFEKIIEIEKKYQVKSTFFFLDESIRFNLFKPLTWKLSLGNYRISDPEVTRIIRWLDKNGWEIGLHGSYNSYKSLELLEKEKENLENIIGHKISGIRQHYLNINRDTWKLQCEAGFKYDASFGLKTTIGFRNNKYVPFFPLEENSEFTVIPLAIMDTCLMSMKDIRKEYIDIIDFAEKNQALLVLNWHQRVFNEKEFPGYSRIYEEIIEECKKRKAQFKLLKIVCEEKQAPANILKYQKIVY